MYVVKLNNKKVTNKLFKAGFDSYESARTILKRWIRSLGHNSDKGYSKLGYSIQRV